MHIVNPPFISVWNNFTVFIYCRPLGQMIRPFIDAMSVQPSGGHAVFDQSQLQGGQSKGNDSSTLGTQSTNTNAQGTQSSMTSQSVVPEATAGNSLPGSTNSSRSDTSDFDLSSEGEEMIYIPFIYNEVLDL